MRLTSWTLLTFCFRSSCYSREDLIVKTLKDVPAFDRLKAETEVDKFLLDYEMMNLYIQYGKEIEKDPDFVVPDNGDDDEGFFSLRTVVVFYLAYVAVTTIPEVTRRFVAEQQVAGTWKATNIPFLDEWIESTTPEATARVLQAAEKVATAAAATNGDALQNIVADVVQAAASGLQ